MKRIKAVLFDLGNTLIYFDGQWPEVIEQSLDNLAKTLQVNGIDLDRENFINQFRARMEQYYIERETDYTEYTTAYFLKRMLVEWGYENVGDGVIRQALAAMYAASQAHWKVEKDTVPTLEKLRDRGCHLGLISNAADDNDVQTLVDNAGIRSFFEIILTSAALGIRKPSPSIFQSALNHWGVQPSQAAMVGDTLSADILGAQKVGILSIWITRRADSAANHTYQDRITPDVKIRTLLELPDVLENHDQGVESKR
jgi:2-haloalkanoic acid dehalogenase type II